MGWAFNSTEVGRGVSPVRLDLLKAEGESDPPDSVQATIDRVDSLAQGGWMDRMKTATSFRGMRQMLLKP